MSSRDRADYIENGLLRMRGLRNETRWRTRLGIVAVSKHQLHRSPTDDLAWLQMPCPTTEPPFSTKVNATVRIGLKEVTALGRSQLCVKVTVKACPNHSGSNDSSRTRWAGFPQKVGACCWRVPPGPPQETHRRGMKPRALMEADTHPSQFLNTRQSLCGGIWSSESVQQCAFWLKGFRTCCITDIILILCSAN